MNPTQPEDGDAECVFDSSDTIVIEVDGPVDYTVRPMDPRWLRKQQQPPGQPPAPEGGSPEHGPDTK
jgi:hypothetical protein